MKKIFFAVLAAIAITLQVSAQDSKNTFGIRVGANLTNVSMKVDDFKIDTDPMIGFHIGASYQREIATNFFVETGLYASTKGYKISDAAYFGVEDEEGSEKTKYNLFYLQLPVLVGYTFDLNDNIALKPFAGGYFGYALSGKAKYAGEKWDLLKDSDEGEKEMKHGDWGLRFGVGADFAQHYYASVGYELGLSNTSAYGEGFSQKNNCFTISLGYNF